MSNPFSAKPDRLAREDDAPPRRIVAKRSPEVPPSPGKGETPRASTTVPLRAAKLKRKENAPPVSEKTPAPEEAPPRERGKAPFQEPAPAQRSPEKKEPMRRPDRATAEPHHAPLAEPEKRVGDEPHPAPPPLGMDEVSCRTCRFFESKGENRALVREGECRCKAPSPGQHHVAVWPVVYWQSWCGEWSLGISDEEMVRMARVVADRMVEGQQRVSFVPPAEDE